MVSTHLFSRSRALASIATVVLFGTLLPTFVEAGPGGTAGPASSISELARRELAARQQMLEDARLAIAEGDRLVGDADYETAIGEYKTALDLLPESPMTLEVRGVAKAKWSDASVAYAQIAAEGGDYELARTLLSDVLAVDPGHAAAKVLLERVNDPEWFNPGISPKLLEDIEKVNELLRLAHDQFEIGRFDDSRETYNKVLRVDRYNSAAQRGLEKVERELINTYYADGRMHMRAQALREVDAAWAPQVPPASLEEMMARRRGALEQPRDSSADTLEKVRTMMIPNVSFTEATVQEAVDFLVAKSKELDTAESDPTKKGVNIINQDSTSEIPLTLELTDMPLAEVLRYIAQMANLRVKVEQYAVKLVPLDQSDSTLYNRVFKVPPDFIRAEAGGGGGGGDPFDPFDPGAGGGGGGASVAARPDAKQMLETLGVDFPEGASAYFDPTTSRLVVRNTTNGIDLIEAIVGERINQAPKQIFITTKFVEITQRNTEEFGFDWTLGQFDIGSSGVFGSGGVTGNSSAGNPTASEVRFPIQFPNGGDVGVNPVTRGLRFGGNAVTRNRIDDLLDAQTVGSALSPGIFSLAGVFSDPQFQVLIRAFDQKKGTDLMSETSIVTRSVQRAKIEVIREFIYPVEFEPPEVPQTIGNPNVGNQQQQQGGNQVTGGFPITPTTPTAFETRNIGVTMEVDPVLGEDGYTIDLSLAPEVVEFEGFINYGSPITAGFVSNTGAPLNAILTENEIPQPIFDTRRVTTSLTIYDGQTVGIGGLIREDVQSVHDKVPVFGDLPLIGRLWQTKADDHFKRNLMIFVTARIIDPSGVPVHDYRELQGGPSAREADPMTDPMMP